MNVLKSFTPNWFDLLVLVLLVVGFVRGRKRGMSEELLDVLKWLLIVVVSAWFYKPVGQFLGGFLHFQPLFSKLLGYSLIGVVIYLAFLLIKRAVGEKLVGSDLFGRMEYYLGMGSGMLRLTCMLMVGLAIFHAYYISDEDLAALEKKRYEVYGSATPYPALGTIHRTVFRQSVFGPIIEKNFSAQLIEPTPYLDPVKRAEAVGKRRESAVNEVLGEPKK